MNILIVAATPFEMAPLENYLNTHFKKGKKYRFEKDNLYIDLLATGVGMAHTGYALGKYLSKNRYDWALNMGIAGCFRTDWSLGTVVNILSERFADLGAEQADGSFQDVFEMGFLEENLIFSKNGSMQNNTAQGFSFLPAANGLTINKVTGSAPTIQAIREKYPDADIESMEGAAFFYACLMEKIPFLEIRAISNYIEPRNKSKWDIPLAIENLNNIVTELLNTLKDI